MAREVHIAIIGAGYWGTKLINEYLALSRELNYIKLSAVVDISRERLDYIAKRFNLPRNMLYTEINTLLDEDIIDAVHIATPNETHYELASIMLKHGKHVLLEKPMALSSHEAFKLARLAETSGKILLVGHIFRFNNALLKVRNMMKSGELGEVRYIDLTWATYLYPPPPKRDIVFDLAPHPVDIINFLLDEWPYEVYAVAQSPVRKTPGLEEYAYAILKLPQEVTASVKLSWLEYGPKKRWVQLVTDRGTVFVDALSQQITLYHRNGATLIHVNPSNTIKEMIKHFINAILGNETPNNSALIGALTVMVLEGMRKSIEKGRPITLPI